MKTMLSDFVESLLRFAAVFILFMGAIGFAKNIGLEPTWWSFAIAGLASAIIAYITRPNG